MGFKLKCFVGLCSAFIHSKGKRDFYQQLQLLNNVFSVVIFFRFKISSLFKLAESPSSLGKVSIPYL